MTEATQPKNATRSGKKPPRDTQQAPSNKNIYSHSNQQEWCPNDEILDLGAWKGLKRGLYQAFEELSG
jgi:hypothetical protein